MNQYHHEICYIIKLQLIKVIALLKFLQPHNRNLFSVIMELYIYIKRYYYLVNFLSLKIIKLLRHCFII